MKKQNIPIFNGFAEANTTPVPDILFDELLSVLTGAELKVLLYIIRRTRGFKKDTDAISLSQFQNGILTKEGKQLDYGCGIGDRQTIINALNSLEEKKCIMSDKGKTPRGDNATTAYRIYFSQQMVVGKSNHRSRENTTTVVDFSNHRSRENTTTVVGKSNPQETDSQLDSVQETVRQESVRIATTAALSPAHMLREKIEHVLENVEETQELFVGQQDNQREAAGQHSYSQGYYETTQKEEETLPVESEDIHAGPITGTRDLVGNASGRTASDQLSAGTRDRALAVSPGGMEEERDGLEPNGYRKGQEHEIPHRTVPDVEIPAPAEQSSSAAPVTQQTTSVPMVLPSFPPLAERKGAPSAHNGSSPAIPPGSAKMPVGAGGKGHKPLQGTLPTPPEPFLPQVGPPPLPPNDAPESFENILALFNHWRGHEPLTDKQMTQANKCAVALFKANYTRPLITEIRKILTAEDYYKSKNWIPDICEVARDASRVREQAAKNLRRRANREASPPQVAPAVPTREVPAPLPVMPVQRRRV